MEGGQAPSGSAAAGGAKGGRIQPEGQISSASARAPTTRLLLTYDGVSPRGPSSSLSTGPGTNQPRQIPEAGLGACQRTSLREPLWRPPLWYQNTI